MTEEGTLKEQQWQFWAQSKPIEELYDTHVDPSEIHNLVYNPEYFEKMSEMRTALDAWIAECDDPLNMPEDQLVRTRVYPPDGRQPTTATASVKLDPIGGKSKLSITCKTKGVSIGFRLRANERKQSSDTDSNSWIIYNGPVQVDATCMIEIVAHRIGFKPSLRVSVQPLQR